jgi:hypothetical protein
MWCWHVLRISQKFSELARNQGIGICRGAARRWLGVQLSRTAYPFRIVQSADNGSVTPRVLTEMWSKLEIPKAAKKRLVSQWQNTSVQFPRRAHASCWSEAWGLKEIQIDQIVSLFDSMPFLHFRKPSESPCCVQLPFCSIVKYCHSIVIKLCFTPGEHSPVVSTTATPAWRSVELKICASEHRGGNNRKNSKRMVRYGKIW